MSDINISDWQRRKAQRKAYYDKYVHGWKQIKCYACNGSGYYDHNGSPPCGGCDGTGKTSVSPERYQQYLDAEARYKQEERRMK